MIDMVTQILAMNMNLEVIIGNLMMNLNFKDIIKALSNEI